MHPLWVQVASKAVSEDPRRTMKMSRERPRLSITAQELVTPSGMAEIGPTSPTGRVTFAGDDSAADGAVLAEGCDAWGRTCTLAPRRHTSDFPRRTPRHSYPLNTSFSPTRRGGVVGPDAAAALAVGMARNATAARSARRPMRCISEFHSHGSSSSTMSCQTLRE